MFAFRRIGADLHAPPIIVQPSGPTARGVWLTFCFGVVACAAWADDPPERLGVEVHRVIAHDPAAFTQGLQWFAGKLYETTGRYGRSELRELDPDTGRVLRQVPISRLHFGEGLARYGDQFVMLTWRAERAYVFGVDGLERQGFKHYRGEGWGLCHDGARFVMSDGSSTLKFRDSASFAVTGSVGVTAEGRGVAGLNELECVAGVVYANIFQQDFLARIDPATGQVEAWIDASELLDPQQAARADVLNGIAFNPDTGRFHVTGKLWPSMFEVTFE